MERTRPPIEEIRMTSTSFSVGEYARPEESSNLRWDLDAPYQRGSVWTEEQKRELIRSTLMGVPVGAIVVSVLEHRHTHWARVVDGKQRIEAYRDFCAGRLSVPADWFPDSMVDWDAVGEDGMAHVGGGLTNRAVVHIMRLPLSALEFRPDTEWIEVDPGTGTHGGAKQFIVRERSDEEILKYEAMVFSLINSAGTPQATETLESAARMAGL